MGACTGQVERHARASGRRSHRWLRNVLHVDASPGQARRWQSLPYLIVCGDVKERLIVATRNISLTAEQDAFIERIVRAGEYQNASEAVRDALRMLQHRRREDALKLKALRAHIKAGIDDLDRGDFVEVDDAELDSFLEGLTDPAGERDR
jgi:antitoxin ParD1/3/4